MLCWRGLPMTSFILYHFRVDPVAVSVACCVSTCYRPVPMCVCAYMCECGCFLCLFSTPAMAPLQNSATLRLSSPYRAPACTYSFSDYLGSTDRALCVILTCLLSTGAPNSTSGPTWITNSPSVGLQTAYCLSFAVFLLESRLECHSLSVSRSWHVHLWLLCTDVLCCCVHFILQTLPQDKLHLCGWHSREPPPQTAEQDAEPGKFSCQ